ncbi:hypothetical protein NW768_001111 [Fusarium equiseti]|uniref:Uncharacterized protein n=1 Tax=Fusarium equiseti TaxID=61235 RepID=A0ABQ8RPJ1_FUSEQ|nr:hypothetical protein NW768_001111 [Fusarium equiseti]
MSIKQTVASTLKDFPFDPEIPEKLLGAAQKIWNSYASYIGSSRSWTGLQRWRIVNCMEGCISAFRSTYGVLLDPLRSSFPVRPGTDVIHAQELASQRRIMSLVYRVLAGEVHTPAEVSANMAAVAPAYIANCPEADTLRNRLRLIDMCPDTATPSEQPTSNLQTFYTSYHADLMSRVKYAVHSGASAPQVTDHTPA